MKKILSVVLTFMLLFSLLPSDVLGVGEEAQSNEKIGVPGLAVEQAGIITELNSEQIAASGTSVEIRLMDAGDIVINFPDPDFEAAVREVINKPTGDIYESDVAGITSLDLYAKNISDLTGIEYFTGIKYLYCSFNKLTSLDVSNNSMLIVLDCRANQLTSLDLSNNTALAELNCWANQLISLDLSNCTSLAYLNCSVNQLTTLNVINNVSLTQLICWDNQLTSLDVSDCISLIYLECRGNQLNSLDVANNVSLTHLDCSSNQLTSLDVTNNKSLTNLSCSINQLTSLDVTKNISLIILGCGNNQLTSLDITNNISLAGLGCDNNQLTSLDVTNNISLTSLDCSNNQLTSLDVLNNSMLILLRCGNNRLTNLDMSNYMSLNWLDCSNNDLEFLNVSDNPMLDLLQCNNNKLTKLDVSNNTAMSALWCNYNNIPSKTAIIGLDLTVTTDLQFYPQYTNDTVIHFPDQNFEAAVREAINKPTGDIYESDVSGIQVLNIPNRNISDLTGIEYFISLEALFCSGNKLTELDVSKNVLLNNLDCFKNNLTELDMSNNTKLETLVCNGNQLSRLDVSKNTMLNILDCYDNNLTELDVSNSTKLSAILGRNNQLEKLDVSKNTLLTLLDCQNNNLTELDVSNNTELVHLQCSGNQLAELDVSQSPKLTHLTCINNQLTELDVSNNVELVWFQCNGNQLTELDLSNNKALTEFNCSANKLTKLDVSKNNKLARLHCSENLLTVLDISGNYELEVLRCTENLLTSLDVSKNLKLKELVLGCNELTELDVSNNPLLLDLQFFDNNITKLSDLSYNPELILLNTGASPLHKLDLSANKKLETLFCYNNKLTELDLSKLTSLSLIDCQDNQLTELDISRLPLLSFIDCQSNDLERLDVSKNPKLSELDCRYNYMPSESAVVGLNKAITTSFRFSPQKTKPIYTVTFADFDGTILKTENVNREQAATAPADPSRNGYTFTGWDVPFNKITANLTVTAKYSPNLFTVIFKNYNGSILKTEVVSFSSSATAPQSPLRAGYTFTGWSKDFSSVSGDLVIMAQFTINKYKVTFVDYDGTVLLEQLNVLHGYSAIPPKNPTRPGYTFTGWDKPLDNISGNMTITAQYIQNPPNVYTVTFVDYDNTVLEVQTVTGGGTAKAPDVPTRGGYIFSGWDTSLNNITGNLTVKAQYTEKPDSVIIDTPGDYDLDKDVVGDLVITASDVKIRNFHVGENVYIYANNVDAVNMTIRGSLFVYSSSIRINNAKDIMGDVFISSTDVEIHNSTIRGNIYIDKNVANGTVTLDKAAIAKTVYIQGGGSNSIYLIDSEIGAVDINKDLSTSSEPVRVVASGNTNVGSAKVNSTALLENSNIAASSKGLRNIVITEKLPINSSVSMTGNFEAVSVKAPGVILELPTGSINNLAIDGNAHDIQIFNNGNIENVQIDETVIDSIAFANEPDKIIITYTMALTAGVGGIITLGETGSYLGGIEIPISAAASSNYIFKNWTTSNGGVFAEENNPNTSFTMPDNATEVTANFEKLPDAAQPNNPQATSAPTTGTGTVAMTPTSIPTSTVAPLAASADGPTDVNDKVSESLNSGKDAEITIKSDKANIEVSGKNLLGLMDKDLGLKISGNKIGITLNSKFINCLGLKSDSNVEISLEPKKASPKKDVSGIDPINKKLIEAAINITLTVDGVEYENFTQPLTLTFNLKDMKLTDDQKTKLTGVRYLPDRSYRQLGGKVASGEIFELKTSKLSQYGVLVSDNLTSIAMSAEKTGYTVNGINMTMDTIPVIIDNYTMVPVRFIAEALGAGVEWIGWRNTVVIKLDGEEMSFRVGSGYAQPDMEVQPVIINERTYVPLRYVSEKLGANVIWNDNGSIEIYR